MQLALPGLTLPATRPLLPVEACMCLLDRTEDEVLHAIECGSLMWAWDIRSPGSTRREIRIWRESLLALLSGTREVDATPLHVAAQILPSRDVRSPELQRLWSCSSTHVHALIESGCLNLSAEPAATSGPQSYSLISRESVLQFLASRRVV